MTKRLLLCAAAITMFLIAPAADAQWVDHTTKPSLARDTTLLLPLDGNTTPATISKGKIVIKGTPKFVEGKFGKAAIFDGAHIQVPTAGNLDMNKGTIEFWMKAPNLEWFDKRHEFLRHDTGWCKPGMITFWLYNGTLRLDHHSMDGGDRAFLVAGIAHDTKWHHIAATWNSETSSMKIMVDGKLHAGRSGSTWTSAANLKPTYTVMSDVGGLLVDEIRITKSALLVPGTPPVKYSVLPGTAKVQDGKTVMPVKVTFTNRTDTPYTIDTSMSVRSYFQQPLGESSAKLTLPAGGSVTQSVPIITDNAGPYVKLSLKATSGGSGFKEIATENICFADTLTGPRMRMSLNGTWQMANANAANMALAPPKLGAWWPKHELPRKDRFWGGHARWFARKIMIPKEMAGKRIQLDLSGVRFKAAVHLNGKFLGQWHTDQMPLAVDLTSAAKPGEVNELYIGVVDWVSCVPPEKIGQYIKQSIGSGNRGSIFGNPMIRACSGEVERAGIVDPIYITASAPAAVSNIYVTPSVRKKELKAQVILRNAEQLKNMQLKLSVFSEGKKVLSIPAVSIAKTKLTATADKGMSQAVITAKWANPKLWWPHDPHMYEMRAELISAGKIVDSFNVRFGFREFWVDGKHLRFNGLNFRPRLQAAWPYNIPAICRAGSMSTIDNWNKTLETFRLIKSVNVNTFRFHTEPWSILMHDAADETGMLITSEAAIASIPFKFSFRDKRIWKNLAGYYRKWAYREFNSPSLVMRSIDNEVGYFLPGGAVLGGPEIGKSTLAGFEEMGRIVKKHDPSRPIMYDGSGSIFDTVADITNIHYPHGEAGSNMRPNSTRWADVPSPSYHVKNWVWSRDRPLIVGEGAFCASRTPAGFASERGNAAYEPQWYVNGQMAIWRMTMEAQRISDITAYDGWCMVWGVPKDIVPTRLRERTVKELNTPIASFIHEYRTHYFGGRELARTITTLNDTLFTKDVTMQWRIEMGGKTVRSGKASKRLVSADRIVTKLTGVKLPVVSKRTDAKFIVETLADGKVVHNAEKQIVLMPDTTPKVNIAGEIAYMGKGKVSDVFKRVGANVRRVTKIPAGGVLLVAGDSGLGAADKKAIAKFLTDGGRLIVLEQKASPEFLPLEFKLVEGRYSPMTICHVRTPDHPIMKGIGANDVRFWREDHITARSSYEKPEYVTGRPIVDCFRGLQQMVAGEYPYGKGAIIIIMQLPLAEMFDTQAAARTILANTLQYAAASAKRPQSPGIIGALADSAGAIRGTMKKNNVDMILLNGMLDKITDLRAYSAIIVEGDDKMVDILLAHGEKFRKYVKQGGTVWLHCLSPQQMARIAGLLPGKVTMAKLRGSNIVNVIGSGLVSGVSNDEFYWPAHTNLLSPVAKRLAAFKVDQTKSTGVTPLTKPAVIATMFDGKGQWFIDQTTWDREYMAVKRSNRLLLTMLTNVGVQITSKAVDATAGMDLGFHPIDIKAVCNGAYLGDVWARGSTAGLQELPTGDQTFKGFRYHLLDAKKDGIKTMIKLLSKNSPKGAKMVTLKVGRKAAQVNMLVTSLWSKNIPFGSAVANVKFIYSDGTSAKADITHGRDVLDWCRPPATHPRTAWIGPKHPAPGIYNWPWKNPHPEKIIDKIELHAADDGGFLVMLAASTQDRLAPSDKKRRWVPGMPEDFKDN